MDLHVIEKGNAGDPAVLLIHGLLGSARNVFSLAGEIASAGFRVVAYDQRGHGHSPHAPHYTLEGLARDALAVLDERKIIQAHLIGHSLGARVALAVCDVAPERAKSLCMLDAGLKISKRAMDELRAVIDRLPEHFSSKPEAAGFLARFPAAMNQFLLSNLRDRGGRMEWIFDLVGLRNALQKSFATDQTEAFRKLTCPVLVVRGERSTSFSPEELEFMQKLLPAAQSAIVKEAGHWLHVDNFQGTAETVINFVRNA